MHFHRLIVAAALCAVFAGVAMAQVSSTRVSPFDFQCQDSAGKRISDHQSTEGGACPFAFYSRPADVRALIKKW